MEEQKQEVSSQTAVPNRRGLWLSLFFGLAAAVYLYLNHFDPEQWRSIRWDARLAGWLALAIVLLLMRHAAYMLRLRTLTGRIFGWKKAALFVTIWEFSAAVAPTSKGGPLAMFFILLKEGAKAGRATAALLYIIFLDSSFFVFSFPIWWWVFGDRVLMPDSAPEQIRQLASGAFIITYLLMSSLWIFLVVFVFLRPQWGRMGLYWLAGWPILNRRATWLQNTADDFLTSSRELRTLPLRDHVLAIVGTLGSWTCKFAMINCLAIAFYPALPTDLATMAFVYARLNAMFIIMMFTPTPGGSGFAEIALAGFLSDLVPQSIGMVVALVWRSMAYYSYLVMGAIASSWYLSSGSRKQS